ncbi:MAG: glycoside hydrolase family 65 protein [Oscillospiraceae bacterium]|nr:glycoside hydrolase family 65 protein [Oscillospiraceae bacterium]
MHRLFDIHPWQLTEHGLHPAHMRLAESLTATGNGLMGMRGNFEEQYTGDTHRGTYLAGIWFPDKTRVGWWKNGYPAYFGKVINAVNLLSLRVRVDGQDIDLARMPATDFFRTLDMRTGLLLRGFDVTLPQGSVRVRVRRFVSLARPELLGIRYSVTPNFPCAVEWLPALDADVRNLDSNYDEMFWDFAGHGETDGALYVAARTKPNPFDTPRFTVAAAMATAFSGAQAQREPAQAHPGYVCQPYTARLNAGQTATLDKFVAVATSRTLADEALAPTACAQALAAAQAGYEAVQREHERAWQAIWDEADVTIQGDDAAQQGIRYNIFQLLSTYRGQDAGLNIGPKGFTGEKYGGATYWDTEAYCLPMYLAVAGDDVARDLLMYRYLQLPGARHNAQQQGLPGALYPMVTFTGVECHNEWEITFEEIHRNAAVAHAIFCYTQYTGRDDYLKQYGMDVLAGIAAFWAGRVHYNRAKGCYMIHGVTGPNEYENNINNNWYTNRMAAWCLAYAADCAALVSPEKRAQLGLDEDTLAGWRDIASRMYLPEDAQLGVFVQHDTFLDKELMPASALPPAERPINKHWSWDRILRSCFIKQADVLQGLYALGHLYDRETKRRNFLFYEPMTVHESSLSPCVHSILAAEIGEREKAVEMYRRTARLDLDNINDDTDDGLHITSMAGSWLAIAHGFAGMRTADGLAFAPFLPDCWQGYAFRIHYRGRILSVQVDARGAVFSILRGEPLPFALYGQTVRAAADAPHTHLF